MSLRLSVVIGVLAVALLGAVLLFTPNKDMGVKQIGDHRPVVAGTIFPVYDIARIVAGPDADVKLILPAGASPHTFDLTPRMAGEFASVDRIFAIGHNLDSWASDVAAAAGGAPIIVLDKNISLHPFNLQALQELPDSEQDEPGEHEGLDPHYWLDPGNGAIMAETIAESLGELDPIHKEAYKQRADAFGRDVVVADQEFQKKLSKFTKRDIATFHDVLGYFAPHYHLNVIASFEPFPGQEPTPQYLATLENSIREHQVSVLFLEPQLSTKTVNAFAKDVGVTLGMIDEAGGVDGRETYIELLRYNVDAIDAALMLIHK